MAHIPTPINSEYDQHLAAVARVIDAWAHLELHIDQAIWRLAALEQAPGACITAQLIGVNRRLRALAALVRLYGGSDESVSAINKFAGRLGSLQQQRDRSVHDSRWLNPATGKLDRLEVSAQRELVFEFRAEDIESLMRFRNQIIGRITSFQTLFQRILGELDALPDTDRPPLPKLIPLMRERAVPASDREGHPPPPRSSRG